ncbi:MAG TPA: SRPBCC family protein [Candidatus Binatia bacterium]|jgi:ligand-binding SRPBCC domain-containing protein|nr:SRPBCC family protein [Candidatus Binatia bacterium]
MKVMHVGLFLLVVGFAGCGGGDVSTPTREIVSESMVKNGDTWTVNFTSKIDAPVDKVWEAFTKPEKAHDLAPENVLKSELIKEDGNTKIVDIVGRLEVLPPGFKVQNIRNEYLYFPGEKRFTQKSIDFKLADLVSEYKFTPTDDGKATLLTFTQTSKDKSPMLVDSLQKGALRETYVTQVKIANKALGIAEPAAKPQG